MLSICRTCRLFVLIVCLATSEVGYCAVDLGEFTLDEKQLRQAVYGRGFNIGLDEAAIERLMQIQSHLQNGEWVKAFRLIESHRNLWAGKQVPRKDGFTLPVDQYLSQLVANLPAEARDAFQTYFRAKAARLLEESQSLPTEQQISLYRRLTTFYLLTDAGIRAANELGDAYFEQGRFRQAAMVWEELLATGRLDLDWEQQLLAKLAMAHVRSRDEQAFRRIANQLRQRFSDATIRMGRERMPVERFIERVHQDSELARGGPDGLATAAAESVSVQLPDPLAKPVWQFDWTTQQRRSGLLNDIPFAMFDESRLLVNHGWGTTAFDIATGKQVWHHGPQVQRKGSLLGAFRNIVRRRFTGVAPQPDAVARSFRYAEKSIVLSKDRLFFQRYENGKIVIYAVDRLSGKQLWKNDGGEEFQIVGNLEYCNDRLAAAAYREEPSSELHILFFNGNGILEASKRLGTVVGIMDRFRGEPIQPSPLLMAFESYLLVQPNDGAVVAVDIENDHEIAWTYRFRSARQENSTGMAFVLSGAQKNETYLRPSATAYRGTLYFRDHNERTLHAIRPLERTVEWERPIDKDSRLVGIDDRFVYVLTAELDSTHTLQMIDRLTHQLQWCPRLPQLVNPVFVNGQRQILVSTNRGVYRIDKKNGRVEMPYRTEFLPAEQHELLSKNGFLVGLSKTNVKVFHAAR